MALFILNNLIYLLCIKRFIFTYIFFDGIADFLSSIAEVVRLFVY